MSSESEPSVQRRRSFIEEARRAQILVAAAEVVAESGYQAATLARIAAHAQISKSVISYHFDGKEEILRLVAEQFFDRAWAYMEQQLAESSAASFQVAMWVGAQLDFFGQHRADFLATSEIVLNHRLADGSRPFLELEADEVSELAKILARGQEAGEFRSFDPLSVSNIILRSVDGVLGSWATDESIDLELQKHVLLEFIDHAIRKESP